MKKSIFPLLLFSPSAPRLSPSTSARRPRRRTTVKSISVSGISSTRPNGTAWTSSRIGAMCTSATAWESRTNRAWEVYIRGGVADLEASSEGFDADLQPFAIVGVKGAFHDGPRFRLGDGGTGRDL